MAAAVVAHVHNQPRVHDLGQKRPVELGIAPWAHVGYVQVADATACGLVHAQTVGLDPLAVTGRSFALKGLDGHRARLVTVLARNRQQHFFARMVDERLLRCQLLAQPVAGDCQQHVALRDIQARLAQRQIVVLLPRITTHDVDDAIATGLVVVDVIRSQKALVVARLRLVVTAELVGMRSAQLALHLPHQIGELGAGGDATHQRPVAAINALPVHVLHVLAPELVALQPPGVAIHLGPFRPGQHHQARPAQIQPTTLPTGRRSVLIVRLVACVQ